ncbi:MAG: hypothetical protein ACO2ZP_04960 [Bacteriovoracaceae bacterium]
MNVEELEKEIQKLKEQRNKYNSLAGAHSWRVEELEKENQELKAKLDKAIECFKILPCLGNCINRKEDKDSSITVSCYKCKILKELEGGEG